MSILECFAFLFAVCILCTVIGVALYYDYRLRLKREQKLNRVLEALERYISLHNK